MEIYMNTKKQPGRKPIKDSLKKTPVGLRLDPKDLSLLKKMSERESIPYQTIIGSIVHKFLDGRLVEKEDEKTKIPKQRETISHSQHSQRAC